MTERITFCKIPTGKNPVTGRPYTNTDAIPVFSCWAAPWNQSLANVIAAIGEELQDMTTFIVRYQQVQPITNDMLIDWNGLKYSISDLSPDHINRDYTRILVKKVTA
jgi:SPP1 family predicted phage head-tail adaptor